MNRAVGTGLYGTGYLSGSPGDRTHFGRRSGDRPLVASCRGPGCAPPGRKSIHIRKLHQVLNSRKRQNIACTSPLLPAHSHFQAIQEQTQHTFHLPGTYRIPFFPPSHAGAAGMYNSALPVMTHRGIIRP
jgi:hypothetical protein